MAGKHCFPAPGFLLVAALNMGVPFPFQLQEGLMALSRFKIRNLILATTLTTTLCLANHAGAQETQLFEARFFVDLNTGIVTALDTLTSDSESIAFNINDAGQVVGESRTLDGAYHAFITGPNGVGIRDLGTVGRRPSEAWGINNSGQIAGTVATGTPARAFISGPDGEGMRDLGTLGDDYSYAYGINDAGQVVGRSGGDYYDSRAFITGPNGEGMRDLGTLGGSSSYAWDINNSGQVAGTSTVADGYFPHAFITGPNGEGMRDLGTLNGDSSYANGINDAGQVVGRSVGHAFITGPDGAEMRSLGTLRGHHYSVAYDINNAGQVVGLSHHFEDPYNRSAFITGPNGEGMTDLNSLVELPQGVIRLTQAFSINNNGQVIAAGLVPEPEIYALMLAGLGLVGFMARRRKDRSISCFE